MCDLYLINKVGFLFGDFLCGLLKMVFFVAFFESFMQTNDMCAFVHVGLENIITKCPNLVQIQT